jgi:hypothetical protein
MKKMYFLVAFALLISVNAQMLSLAETMEKQPPASGATAQTGQAMTPTEKYNLLGKQTPSADHSFQPAYGTPSPADSNAEDAKEKQTSQ